MIYKRTIKNQLYVLKGLIINTIVFFAILFICYSSEQNNNVTTFFILLSVWSILFLIILFLHIDYYLKAKKVEIDNTLRCITFDDLKPIPFNEINKIVICVTPELVKKMVKSTPFGDYHYAKFITNNGESYYFTSLLCNNVQKELSTLPILKEGKVKLLASTFWS